MHTLFDGLIRGKFVVLNFAEAFRLHATSRHIALLKSTLGLFVAISSSASTSGFCLH